MPKQAYRAATSNVKGTIIQPDITMKNSFLVKHSKLVKTLLPFCAWKDAVLPKFQSASLSIISLFTSFAMVNMYSSVRSNLSLMHRSERWSAGRTCIIDWVMPSLSASNSWRNGHWFIEAPASHAQAGGLKKRRKSKRANEQLLFCQPTTKRFEFQNDKTSFFFFFRHFCS